MSDVSRSQFEEHKFTNEAINKVYEYLGTLREDFVQTDLEETEIVEVVQEIGEHVIEYCKIKSGGDVVTTDLVKSAIAKLGTPERILATYKEEATYFDEVKDDEGSSEPKPTETIKITVGQLLRIHNLSSRVFLFTAIMVLYTVFTDTETAEIVALFYLIIYVIPFFLLVWLRIDESTRFNPVVRKKLQPSFSIAILPLLVLLVAMLSSLDFTTFVMLLIPVICQLYLYSTRLGQEYLKERSKQIEFLINKLMSLE